MILKQLRSADGTGTLTYILGDERTKAAVVIDPNRPDVDLILRAIRDLGLNLTTIIDTHTHADHYTGAQLLKGKTEAKLIMHTNAAGKWQFVHLGDAFGIGDILRANVDVAVDRFVDEGDVIVVGDLRLDVLYAPGHTNDHIALLANNYLFTGDVLLVGQAGRSDLPSGDTQEQYRTLFGKFLTLPDETVILPGHDYEGNESSTLGIEKETNPFLTPRTQEEYVAFVHEFFPPIADTAAGNVVLQCGTRRVFEEKNEFVNITPNALEAMIASDAPIIIDVREPDELLYLGAISGVINIPVGTLVRGKFDLDKLKDKKVVVVCQTGGRSLEAAHYLVTKGVKNVFNLASGTLGWMMAGKKVARVTRAAVTA